MYIHDAKYLGAMQDEKTNDMSKSASSKYKAALSLLRQLADGTQRNRGFYSGSGLTK